VYLVIKKTGTHYPLFQANQVRYDLELLEVTGYSYTLYYLRYQELGSKGVN
jgi:hypothetical protein